MDHIIGVSTWTQRLRQTIAQVAACRSSVMIAGPSGTGKELIARAIHRGSPRAAAPFVVVDCTSIPAGVFASQLFGHVKGSFSGATCDTLGCVRAADGGTLFLDEIGELSGELQAQLLRVIQQRTVVPVGGCREVPVDVRVLAATNRQLAEEVKAGCFRLDLYYRLNVVQIDTMPLCRRPEDVPPLCRHFLAKLAIENGLPPKHLSPTALDLLMSFPWPGNVRQLHNVLERALVFTPGMEITPQRLLELVEPEMQSLHTPANGFPAAMPFGVPGLAAEAEVVPVGGQDEIQPWPTLAQWDRRLIEETLRRTSYNQRAAARLLGIDRRVLARMIRKFGIELRPLVPQPELLSFPENLRRRRAA